MTAIVLTGALLGSPALGQFPPRPPADIDQGPLPPPPSGPIRPQQQQLPPLQPPEQRPLPPPQQQPNIIAPPAEPKQKARTKQKAAPKNQPPPQPPAAAPETMTQPLEERIANPTATFSGLDKISGRIITFDVALNETVQFGALQVTPRACYTRPPTETQNTTAFVEVDEITLKAEIKRIFTGWMFATSPGLNAVEHPIYDTWLIDCKTTPPSITPPEGKQ